MKRFASLVLLALAAFAAQAQTQPSYQGLWWASPAGSESGWGLNIAHQGNIVFATWFTYDANGEPMWLVMPRGELQNADMGNDPYGYGGGMMLLMYEYMGPIYRTTGPAFDAASFNPGSVNVTQVGDASIMFHVGQAEGFFTYTIDGMTQSKTIMRQVFSPRVSTCDFASVNGNFQDLWWAWPANSESGWGINLTQQGDVMFATWFTYDKAGKGMWLVASEVRQASSNIWAGALYKTTGPAFNAPSWDITKVKATSVGSITLAFGADGDSAKLTANVNGTTVEKNITRQVFASPMSSCR